MLDMRCALCAIFTLWPLVLGAGPGLAEESRFVLKPAGDGFVRLDSETGQLTHCRQHDAQWKCADLEGGTALSENDLARLRKENAALSQRVDELQRSVDHLTLQLEETGTELRLPSDDEMDKVFGFMEKFMRRFMELGRTLSGPPSKDI